ncbi:MAG TPA: NnrS family protein [Polyangia bacterium]
MSLLRREPFRLFFPLGLVLGAAGIAHWLLFTTGLSRHYLGRFHAVTQTQAFLVAFAAGFLGTAIPKRTRTAPATWLELGTLLIALPVVSLATLLDLEAVGQVAYAVALVTLAQFAARRFVRRGARRPPASFALVPIGLLAGLAGAGFIVASRVGAGALPGWAHALGARLTLEGVFTCLTLGVGAFFLPLAGRGQAAPDLTPERRWPAAAYAGGGAAIIAGLLLEVLGATRVGPALRGTVALAIIAGSGAWRLPSRPGTNRTLLWLGIWALPVGLLGAAAFPAARVAALHVMFVGGFGVLSFAVSTHVALGHSGQEARQSARSRAVAGFGALFALALVARIAAPGDPANYFRWLGVAAGAWMLGAIVWAAIVLPSVLRAPVALQDQAQTPAP